MAFYDLQKEERHQLVQQINQVILTEIVSENEGKLLPYFSDEDTYIRKTAYLAIGKIYQADNEHLADIIKLLENLLPNDDFKVRQTVVNAAGEFGKKRFRSGATFLRQRVI